MSIARSVAQQQFDAEYEKIQRQRAIDTGVAASLEFISAVSTSLAIMDVVQIAGLPLSITFAVSFASLAFWGVVGVTVACGIFCAVYLVNEGDYRKNIELNLMRECFSLKTSKEKKLEGFAVLLEKLLALTVDVFIAERYEKIKCGDAVDQNINEINGYIKYTMRQNFPDLIRQSKLKTPKTPDRISPPNYRINNFIAFFSGAGLMLGIIATLFGAFPMTGLLFTPAGWGIALIILALCVATGALQLYFDYQSRQEQQVHTEKLEEQKLELTLNNKYIDKAALRVENYLVILSLQEKVMSGSVLVEGGSACEPTAPLVLNPASIEIDYGYQCEQVMTEQRLAVGS